MLHLNIIVKIIKWKNISINYCSKCKKIVCIHARKDAAIRKVNNYVSKCCKVRLTVIILCSILEELKT